MAITASTSAVFRDRFIVVLVAAGVICFAVFLFEGGFVVVVDDDGLDFSRVAACVGGGFAYTVNDRVFLVVERVATGMFVSIAQRWCVMVCGEKELGGLWKGRRDGGGQDARSIDNGRLKMLNFSPRAPLRHSGFHGQFFALSYLTMQ